MQWYLAKRAAQAALVMYLVLTVVFFLGRVLGDPVSLFVGDQATVEDIEMVRHNLGLDRHILVQYGQYLADLVRGDLGDSLLIRGFSVASLLGPAVLNSIKLATVAMVGAVVVGAPLGLFAAVHRGTPLDTGARLLAVTGLVTPGWWLGIIGIIVFSVYWNILPPSGIGTAKHYIMPASVLGFHAMAGIARLSRSSMLDVLESEYLKMARAKGLPWSRVIWLHGFRNALIPVVTYVGLYFAILITAAVVVEVVFSWPGMGRLMYEALSRRDFPVLQGAVLLSAAFVVGVNFMIDVLYALIDPRIRYS